MRNIVENLGSDHAQVASYQSSLALVYQNLERYEEAIDLLESALKSNLNNYDKDHPNVAISQSNLALVYR